MREKTENWEVMHVVWTCTKVMEICNILWVPEKLERVHVISYQFLNELEAIAHGAGLLKSGHYTPHPLS
jgi:hypothetical protein